MTLELSPAPGEACGRGKGLRSCGGLGLSRNPAVPPGPGSSGTLRRFTDKDAPTCGTADVQVTFEEPKFVNFFFFFSDKRFSKRIEALFYTKVGRIEPGLTAS